MEGFYMQQIDWQATLICYTLMSALLGYLVGMIVHGKDETFSTTPKTQTTNETPICVYNEKKELELQALRQKNIFGTPFGKNVRKINILYKDGKKVSFHNEYGISVSGETGNYLLTLKYKDKEITINQNNTISIEYIK